MAQDLATPLNFESYAVEDIFADIYNKEPTHSYTNFVVDNRGLWLCPKCHWQSHSPQEWAFWERGYRRIDKNYNHDIHKSYGSDHAKMLYFANPAAVVQCQNQWDHGFSGSPCTFNREEAEGTRYEEKEEFYDNARGQTIGICTQCSVLTLSLEKNHERRTYIESQNMLQMGKIGVGAYVERPNDPYCGLRMYLRLIVYDGTPESLKCPTDHWGEGNGEESKDKPCVGRYGGPVVFWASGRKEVLERLRMMVETGEFREEIKTSKLIENDDKDFDNGKLKLVRVDKILMWYPWNFTPGEPWREGANNFSDDEIIDYGDDDSSSSSWSSRVHIYEYTSS
ncbi:uncharacterized protein K460DRAFT_405488 [Cucurbitaria berberidis CBS 394.84]|uniref:Uncharacterized protein n=1 Tax=Cucurbitaria berberidis CBS 394.84 TaxID=1168544 RepID=A0A9P4GGV2_9PLEO|nr:uncharacterized protein K460DRAFT_405488 [Cucurbitaria berberidis CBS 394.84]KAF1845219.1 hypothetical protein K460DRAFT_405488 [Cucurbitaria berberidis CBS 394.84]